MNEITEGNFPEVRSRQEMYLQDIIKSLSNESISDNNYPDPLSRQEAYLQIIISKLRANDPNIEINTEDIEKAVNKYLEQNPIQPGATEDQANTIDVVKTYIFENSIHIVDMNSYYSDEKRFITSKGEPQTNSYTGANDRVCEPVPVVAGDMYIVKTHYTDERGYQFLDENKNVIFFKTAGMGNTVNTLTLTIPDGVAYFRVGSEKGNNIIIYHIVYSAIAENTSAIAENTSAIAENTSAIAENTSIIKNSDGKKISLIDRYVTGNFYINKNGILISGFTGDRATDFIEVKPNTKYIYIGYMSDERGYAVYDAEKKRIDGMSALELEPETRCVDSVVFFTPSNAKYVRFSVYGSAYHDIAYIKERGTDVRDWISEIEKQIDLKDTNITTYVPAVIYAIDNDSVQFYGRDYVQSVYPEGIVLENINTLINGRKRLILQRNANNVNDVEDMQIPFTITGKSIIDEAAIISFRKVKASVAKGKTIRCLSIGDSITANQIPNYDGVKRGPVCYMSVMDLLSKLNSIDFDDNSIKYIPLGTTNKYNDSLYTYKGENVTITNIGEGRGSWTTADYLRHPISMCGKGSTSGSTSGQSQGKATWDLLGLGTRQSIDSLYDSNADYTEFIADDEHYDIIRVTPMGYYHWDYTTDVWEWCKRKNSSLANGDWSASDSQKQVIDLICEALLDNPLNPFYDRNSAKSGDVAFNIQTYLDRYKTLEDDGITRLSVGSNAGSKVSNADDYDVCTPTHIIIETGENDRWWYSYDYEKTAEDVLKLMNAIHVVIPDAYVGFATTRTVGVRNSAFWNDYAYAKKSELSTYKFNLNKSVGGMVDNEKREYCIPTYATHSPISCQTTRKDIDLVDGSEKVIVGSDSVHPGIWAYWSMGYQMLAWIYYTLTL